MPTWTGADTDELRDLIDKRGRLGLDAITAEDSALIKQAFKSMDPESGEATYVAAVRAFPTEHGEALDELDAEAERGRPTH